MSEKEFLDLTAEYFRSITTLSTALLLLIPVLLERMKKSQARWLLVIALLFYMFSAALAVGGQGAIVTWGNGAYVNSQEMRNIGTDWANRFQIATLVTFAFGILALAAFGITNLVRNRDETVQEEID